MVVNQKEETHQRLDVLSSYGLLVENNCWGHTHSSTPLPQKKKKKKMSMVQV
jgi:hypothetical protein